MIPYAILTGQLYNNNDKILDISIQELSLEGFVFRAIFDIEYFNQNVNKIILNFYEYCNQKYKNIEIEDYHIELIESNKFYNTFRVVINNGKTKNKDTEEFSNYSKSAMLLSKEYMNYIDSKLNLSDTDITKEMLGKDIYGDEMLGSLKKAGKSKVSSFSKAITELKYGILLASNKLVFEYLNSSLEEFKREYFNRSIMEKHPLLNAKIEYIYVGNSFCINQFPQFDKLTHLFEKSKVEGLHICLVLAPVPQSKEKNIYSELNKIEEFLSENNQEEKNMIELEINDLGTLNYIKIQEYQHIKVTLGILLNKRRKDARIKHKYSENELKLIEDNNLNNREYLDRLIEKYNVSRLTYESIGYSQKIAMKNSTMYIPFYQTNTATFCTLKACVEKNDRGKISRSENCNRYCESNLVIYPNSLDMIGRYNSIYGIDYEVLEDEKTLLEYAEEGVDRIILNLE